MMNFLFVLSFSIMYTYIEALSMNYMYIYLMSLLGLIMYTYFPLGLGVSETNLVMGMDSVSSSLILLSLWVVILMVMSSDTIWVSNTSSKEFMMLMIFLLMSLLISFSSVNMMLFYFFFEVSLIPTLLMIMGWGYQPERTQAGVYFLFYTLTASLPLLLGLFYIYSNLGTLNFLMWKEGAFLGSSKYFLLFSLVAAFLVKMPMFLTHLWLPKAHVEAPVAGSMILAGVLLKLGGFGLLRLMNLFYCLTGYLSSLMVSLGLLSMFYVGLICCRVFDLKALIAYSSVAHMALIICAVFTYSWWGSVGCLAMMISHGVASSGLFCLVNMYYERSHSRSIYLNSGLILTSSIFSLMMFMLCAANISAPPTINLLSEILLMGSIMFFDSYMMMIFPLGSFIGAIYIVYMYSYSQHGKNYYLNNMGYNYNSREYLTLSLHILPLNFLIIFFYMFL